MAVIVIPTVLVVGFLSGGEGEGGVKDALRGDISNKSGILRLKYGNAIEEW